MPDHDRAGQVVDWVVGLMSADAEPSPTRDYYLTLLQRGRGVPEALGMAVDDLLEEVRSAVSRGETYSVRVHRARLGLPSYIPFSPHRLPRPALVRRIVLERVGDNRPPSRSSGPHRGQG